MSRGPDFVLVGAMRSGSTSLYRALADHPGVHMAPGKELRYFDRYYDRGEDWYLAHFDGAPPGSVVGEATPDYLYADGALERMAADLPRVKALVILREPVDRAYSHYRMSVARRREDRRWDDVVDEELGGVVGEGYLDRSRFGRQLERLHALVGADRSHVVAFESLRDEPGPTFAGVCDFVGIPVVLPPSLGRKVNGYFRVRSHGLRSVARRLPGRAGAAVARLNHVEEPYEPMSPATRARIEAALADDTARAVELAGWPTNPWG